MIILIITIIMSMLITIIIPRLFRLVCETIGTIYYIYKPSRDYIYIYMNLQDLYIRSKSVLMNEMMFIVGCC
jgi:hypothetical protein